VAGEARRNVKRSKRRNEVTPNAGFTWKASGRRSSIRMRRLSRPSTACADSRSDPCVTHNARVATHCPLLAPSARRLSAIPCPLPQYRFQLSHSCGMRDVRQSDTSQPAGLTTRCSAAALDRSLVFSLTFGIVWLGRITDRYISFERAFLLAWVAQTVLFTICAHRTPSKWLLGLAVQGQVSGTRAILGTPPSRSFPPP